MKIKKAKIKGLLNKLRLEDCTRDELKIILKAMCKEYYPTDYFEDTPPFRELKEVVRLQLVNIV